MIQFVLLLTGKGKEATFAVASVTVDSQLRKRDIESFCANCYLCPTPKIVI